METTDSDKKAESVLSAEAINTIMDKEFEGIAADDKERLQKALNRALILIGIEEKKRSCHKCSWVYNTSNGHDECSICGEDGGSPWDC